MLLTTSASPRSAIARLVLLGLTTALVTACGSGSGGSTDLNGSGQAVTVPTLRTFTETFAARPAAGTDLVSGEIPQHARFRGGRLVGNGAWIVRPNETGVMNFATPVDAVRFATRENFTILGTEPAASKLDTALAAATQEKKEGPAVAQAIQAPFNVDMYVRGTELGWAVAPAQRLSEVATNVAEVVLPLTTASTGPTGQFKIADAGWTAATNCGEGASPGPITLGVAFTMGCGANPPNIGLNIEQDGNYRFRVDFSNVESPTVTVSRVTGGGGGGGGGEGPPPVTGAEIRVYVAGTPTATNANPDPVLLKTVTGAQARLIDEARRGAESRIVRIEIENKGGAGDIGIEEVSWTADPQRAPTARPINVFYTQPGSSYTNTRLTIAGQTFNCVPTTSTTLPAELRSNFGCVVRGVSLMPYQNYVVGVTNDAGQQSSINLNADNSLQPAYTFAGGAVARVGALPIVPRNANEVILFYKREDNNYTGWGLHLFPTDPAGDSWTQFPTPGEYLPAGVDPQFGAYFRIGLPGAITNYSNNPPAITTFPNVLGFIIHKGNDKDPGPDQFIRIRQDGQILFVVSGSTAVSGVPPTGAAVRITGAAAHWMPGSASGSTNPVNTLLWNAPATVARAELLYSPDGSIRPSSGGLTGTFTTLALTRGGTNPAAGNTPAVTTARHLRSLPAWTLPASVTLENAHAIARSQMVVVGRNADGDIVAATRVQTPYAIDTLYAAAARTAALGPTYTGNIPTLRVWAPTALTTPGVSVKLYNAAGVLQQTVPMALDAASGVWSVTGQASWDRLFYTISLRVYSYAVDQIVDNETTDPYSVTLSTDSNRSQFVNLNDADLKPVGWDTLTKPALAAPEDAVLYELHVRDFSIADATVPAGDRGKYTAFDLAAPSAGRTHLTQLAQAGLTHVHILPSFDFATVRENPDDRIELDDTVDELCAANAAAAALCPANSSKTIRQFLVEQSSGNPQNRTVQQVVGWLRGLDGFNWGYDPLHFGTPEGSYSTNANGPARVLEFRRMVKGLSDMGLRTVMDVVYNHTNASGQSPRSVLDKLVPGYYHRRDQNTGDVKKDSCCDDTASEYVMMEKLMIDTLVRFTRDYKVDGYRFDIMGFHTLDNIRNAQTAVKAVDPSSYLYGEGWNFGDVADDRRFIQARQANLGTTGIGSFSDRIRDPIRGGGPFDSGQGHVNTQGFINGQFYDPNGSNTGAATEQTALLRGKDLIRTFVAGGLRSYSFTNAAGSTVQSSAVDYGGQQAGYTEDPSEAINYIAAHDNETLWDISAYKHPRNTPTAERVRAQILGHSMILLAQGIPFIHAGEEILRSKSMDRNTFDSGDWFNEVDWTAATGKWGVGFPPEGDNAGNYAVLPPIFGDATNNPTQADRTFAFDVIRDFLRIRGSSTLFRLRTADQIKSRLRFLNTGPFQKPGVFAYKIDGCSDAALPGQPYGAVVVITNATKSPQTLNEFGNEDYDLHPIQAALAGADPVVRNGASHGTNGFTVPARTTAVFVRAAQTSCAPYPRPLFVRGLLRGGNGDWSTSRALDFTAGPNYQSTYNDIEAGQQEFKIADTGWAADTNCGGATSGVTVQLGRPTILSCFADSQNLRITPPSSGSYVFRLDATSLTNPVLTVSRSTLAAQMFVRGSFNDWGNGPAPTTPMTYDGVGRYRATTNLNAGSINFKVADSGWSAPFNCGAAAGGGPNTVTVGTPFALTCADGTGNLNLTLPATGAYLFNVDATNPAAPSLTVERAPFDVALFVRGLGEDWSDAASNRMTYLGGGVYEYLRQLPAGNDTFKVADSGWSTGTNCGGSTPLTIGTAYPLNCVGPGNDDITLPAMAPGFYLFNLNAMDPIAPQLTVTGP